MIEKSDMRLERAFYEEIDEVLALYRACALNAYLNSEVGWDEEYPSFEMAEFDLDQEGLYVVRDEGVIIAALSLLPSDASTDGDADLLSPEGSSVLARLCVHPDWQRQGLGTQLIEMAVARARDHDCQSIRLLCLTEDGITRKLCRRHGFANIGIRNLYGHSFLLMERILA